MAEVSLFLFHHDLRLRDNTGLIELAKLGKPIVPLFIFDSSQIESSETVECESHFLNFMVTAVENLDQELGYLGSRLIVRVGDTIDEVLKVIKELQDVFSFKVGTLAFHEDYTPFAIHRDRNLIERVEELYDTTVETFSDHTLAPIDRIVSKAGTGYRIFSFFHEAAKKYDVPLPRHFDGKFVSVDVGDKLSVESIPIEVKDLPIDPSRSEALKIIRRESKCKDYGTTRDMLDRETSGLSPYIRFGIVSIREVFHGIKDEEFRRQLYWRDFYFNLVKNWGQHNKESIYTYQAEWGIRSPTDSETLRLFELWKNGETGIPVIDAGMKQMNATGIMPNRARLLCASYLVKNLHIPWRIGERYFAMKLIDYDFCQNFGNWTWVVGLLPHSQMKFRSFNPLTQGKEYDPLLKYSKRWVPALNDIVDLKLVHSVGYKEQLVNLAESSAILFNWLK